MNIQARYTVYVSSMFVPCFTQCYWMIMNNQLPWTSILFKTLSGKPRDAEVPLCSGQETHISLMVSITVAKLLFKGCTVFMRAFCKRRWVSGDHGNHTASPMAAAATFKWNLHGTNFQHISSIFLTHFHSILSMLSLGASGLSHTEWHPCCYCGQNVCHYIKWLTSDDTKDILPEITAWSSCSMKWACQHRVTQCQKLLQAYASCGCLFSAWWLFLSTCVHANYLYKFLHVHPPPP